VSLEDTDTDRIEMGYVQFYQDGPRAEGTAPKYKEMKIEFDGKIYKFRIPSISFPLKEGTEIIIETDEGIKTFIWHSVENQGPQP
jgi:hypothetical protein